MKEVFGKSLSSFYSALVGRNDRYLLLVFVVFQIMSHFRTKHGKTVKIFKGNRKYPFCAFVMKSDCINGIESNRFKESDDDIYGNGLTWQVFSILPGIAEVRNKSNNFLGSASFQSISKEVELH